MRRSTPSRVGDERCAMARGTHRRSASLFVAAGAAESRLRAQRTVSARPAYDTTSRPARASTPGSSVAGSPARSTAALRRPRRRGRASSRLAGIALPNGASVALHEPFGFHRVAHFSEQGRSSAGTGTWTGSSARSPVTGWCEARCRSGVTWRCATGAIGELRRSRRHPRGQLVAQEQVVLRLGGRSGASRRGSGRADRPRR